jgi:hypothetical protein
VATGTVNPELLNYLEMIIKSSNTSIMNAYQISDTNSNTTSELLCNTTSTSVDSNTDLVNLDTTLKKFQNLGCHSDIGTPSTCACFLISSMGTQCCQ